MARGAEGKARRKEQRKNAEKTAYDMLNSGISHDFGPAEDFEDKDNEEKEKEEEETDELPMPPSSGLNSNDVGDNLDLPPPKKKEKETKAVKKAMKAAGAASGGGGGGGGGGIKTTPLILLIMMTATSVLPVLIYASDFIGNFFQKHHVFGAVGYQLGIGSSPKQRVLSFYEKHNPTKLDEVPTLLAKYYGDYPKLIKKLERKYGDYGYFLGWEEDEAPMTLALEQLQETREYFANQFNIYAPEPIKTAVRNAQYNIGKLVKKFKKVWKKSIWPMLEPFLGVPDGAKAQKRKDAKEARNRRAEASGSSGKRRRKNTEYRDDIEDEH